MLRPSVTRVAAFLHVAYLLGASSAHALPGRVVAIGDEWLFSQDAFSALPSETATLATNLASFLTGGEAGSFLVYSDVNATLSGASLAATLTGAGHSWTIDPSVPLTVSDLAAFDAVFFSGGPAAGATNAAILEEYVETAGAVVVLAGTSWYGGAVEEANAWNPLLNRFGLALGDIWFETTNNVSVPAQPGTHPLRAGVDRFRWGFGQSAFELDPSNPSTRVAIVGDFGGTAGIQPAIATVPEPGAGGLLGTGVLLALALRRGGRRETDERRSG
jgi:hypothetical protein